MSIVGVGCRATGTDFDHEWFGMDRLAAAGLTPRQRTTLQVAVEALDDSGLGCLATGSPAAVVFGAIGGTNSAHHLSRALDLRGPSLTVDSQRASPLVAVDMGVRLLADESVPFVIAGGVDLTLLPDISDLRLPVSRDIDGDPSAGIGRCTVLVLQRTADALRTRTRRYAEIGGPGIGFREARSTDAHIALDDPARPGGAPEYDRGEEPPVLIPVAGLDPATIHHLALRWAVALGSYRSLREFAAATARLVPEPTRAAILARDSVEAAAQLRTLARRIATTSASFPPGHAPASSSPHGTPPTLTLPGTSVTDVFAPVQGKRAGGVLFLFAGTGANRRMGRTLAARYPVFATALTAAVDAVAAAGGPRVWTPRYGFDHMAAAATSDADSMAPTPGGLPDRGEVVFRQLSLFAFQVALAELLESWGIRADAVAGHGAGEIAAAVMCGALSLEDAARVAVARARLLARAGGGGAGAVLEATPAEVNRLVEPMRAEVAVDAVDGSSITVSGEPRYVDALVRRAHRRAIFAQRLADESLPELSHLPKVRDRAAELCRELGDLTPAMPWRPLYSTTRRGIVLGAGDGLRTDDQYWTANISNATELVAALEAAAADGVSTVLELGPAPVLTPAVRERVALRDGAHAVLSVDDEAGSFLRTIARLFLEGRTVDWTALGPHTTAPPQRQWRRPDSVDTGGWPRGGFAADGHPPGPVFPEVEIRAEGTYVVAGGLGPQGEAAVRWLLGAGARDVVVLTRTPRPLPSRLTGMEDRIVMMRCDCADRTDLATALQDIRECGSAVRGVVHASGATRLVAATNLLELTAADPTDFTVLLTSAPGAAEPASVRELAAAQADRRVICVEWEVGPAA
ncbi:acyltransferase domain-containing protein [Nocardia tengchongensis]|uniref:acyltransferase domain-containing protein n=1 Tax=Nocardia tengchongensis TaxID=2055889 RepID=UPI0036A007F7